VWLGDYPPRIRIAAEEISVYFWQSTNIRAGIGKKWSGEGLGVNIETRRKHYQWEYEENYYYRVILVIVLRGEKTVFCLESASLG
jgi:hypothetical protein